MNRVLIVLFLVFCNTLPFVLADSNAEFFEQLRASGVVTDNESILLSSNVYFYPNKKGHGILSGGKGREKGHIVFTEKGFAVISWNRRKKLYEVIHQENYQDLSSTDISGNSPMVRLVTESKASGKYNSYELMDSRNALTPNVSKTKEARKLVTAGIQGLDVKEMTTVKDISAAEVAMQKKKMQSLEERIQRLEEANTSGEEIEKECDCKCEK